MSIVDEEQATPTPDRRAHVEALVDKCPERPTNGKDGVNQRMLENLRTPGYMDPGTAAAKKKSAAGRKASK